MSDLQHGAPGDYDDPANGPIYDERRRLGPLVRMLVLAAIVVAVVAFAGLVWFAYSEGVRSGAEEAAPVLRADPEPVKRKPTDAGGMNIPHQDKLVFDRIAPGQAQTSVERLLPPPESPLDRSTLPAEPPAEPAAGLAAEPPPAPALPPVVPPSDSAQAPRLPAVEPPAAPAGDGKPAAGGTPFVRTPEPPAPPPVPEPPTQQAAVPAPPPAATVPPASTEPPAVAGPAWRVQLASLTSEAAAQQAWARLQKANEDLLGGLSLNVQTATLAKGNYYRIQAGPLADRATASALCGALKTRKQDCLVVAP